MRLRADPDIDGGKGEQIVLNQSGNVITGSTSDGTYFTITIDPDGSVTTDAGDVVFVLTTDQPIWHSETGSSGVR